MKPIHWLVMIILVQSVCAIGIGPVQTYLEYNPGKTDDISLRIFGQGNINLSVRGELADYITLQNVVNVTKHTDIIYTITHPTGLSPGAHYALIVATKMPTEKTGVNALESVVHTLRLQVPYQGSYAEAKMFITAFEDHARFDIDVYNFGDQTDAYGTVEIAGTTVETQRENIPTFGEARLSTAAYLAQGIYNATATVYYDGKSIVLNDSFRIGRINVLIKNITVGYFKPGEIIPITIQLQNDYFEPVEVSGEIIIQNNRSQTVIYTPDTLLDGNTTITAYWEGASAGRYQGTLNIIHADGRQTKDFQIIIPLPEPKSHYLFIGLVLLLAVIFFLLFKKVFKIRLFPRK